MMSQELVEVKQRAGSVDHSFITCKDRYGKYSRPRIWGGGGGKVYKRVGERKVSMQTGNDRLESV